MITIRIAAIRVFRELFEGEGGGGGGGEDVALLDSMLFFIFIPSLSG
jgi:hypothetical protein